MKRILFHAVAASLSLGVCLAALYLFTPALARILRPMLLDYAFASMSDEDRRRMYDEIAADVDAVWDVVPEPLVARIGRRGSVTVIKQAEVRFNNAGMRSARPYLPKDARTFRIVCLGDSMVFGSGAPEPDRFCDQIEQFYRDRGVRAEGKRIQAYAVGLPSWTAVQEATYLSSRITAYDPDVILVLTMSNDIADLSGVTGVGTLTNDFSPEHRNRGSGVFSNYAGMPFGSLAPGPLNTDLVPEARDHWRKAMSALGRLTNLQRSRGKRILHSVMQLDNFYFTEVYKAYFQQLGIDAPMIVTDFFRSEGNQLAHDAHPNRSGHTILSSHYIRAMDALGWIPLDASLLPELHDGLTLDFERPADPEELERLRREFADSVLRTSLDFNRFERGDVRSFLGGLMPARRGAKAYDSPPWASVRSGFALRRPSQARALRVTLRLPARVELFPFRLELRLDGHPAGSWEFTEPSEAGLHTLVAELPPLVPGAEALEVLLETDSYFTEIHDPRMKSFELLSARVE